MRTIERDIVGTFIFSSDGCILLGKSHKGGVYQDTWIVPGGGMEENETLLEAARRETLEEVGVDIAEFEVKPLEQTFTGESKKFLKDAKEEVMVKMVFYNFTVHTHKPAHEVSVSCNDDIAIATWHKLEDLPGLTITEPMRQVFVGLGHLHS